MIEETLALLKTASEQAIIVPCGDIVSDCLLGGLQGSDVVDNVLYGFPHPSGLNSHAPEKFNNAKVELYQTIKKVWRC